MSKLNIILFISLLLLKVSAYDYYVFAQELPSTVCQYQNCQSAYMGNLPDNQLNIHGLWPQNNDGSWPSFCDQSSTSYSDYQVSSSTLKGLNYQWNGLYSSSSVFRNHEWQKHGSCFDTGDSLTSSFIESKLRRLSVNQQMDQFFAAGISVSNKLGLSKIIYSRSSWTFDGLTQAISNHLGVSQFSLECKSQYLSGIQVCVSLDFEPMDCSQLESGNQCPQSFSIPSLN